MHVLYGFDVINEIDKPNRSGLYFLIRFAQTKITLFIFWNNWVIKENDSFLLVEPCSRVAYNISFVNISLSVQSIPY